MGSDKATKFKISYAQYGEDVIIGSLLDGVHKGFYVDVGANYPTTDSVTAAFYMNGWHGINIEPIEFLYRELLRDRPRDININCGAGSSESKVTLRQYMGAHGHSTMVDSRKASNSSEDFVDIEVSILPLKYILEKYKIKKIDFMKIDVEGYEAEVIKGNDWNKFRPQVVCIEANQVFMDWHTKLEKANYRLFLFDGLNEYYVADESWQITEGFSERAVTASHATLTYGQALIFDDIKKQVVQRDKNIATREIERMAMENIITDLREAQKLSLHGRSFPQRLLRCAYGLTVDWFRYKFHDKRK